MLCSPLCPLPSEQLSLVSSTAGSHKSAFTPELEHSHRLCYFLSGQLFNPGKHLPLARGNGTILSEDR